MSPDGNLHRRPVGSDRPAMRLLTLLTLGVIIGATLLANAGLAEGAFRLVRAVPGGDLIGHFGLYGSLSYGLGGWMRRSQPKRWVGILAGVAVLVSVEEIAQMAIPTRTFSLADLAASLSGLLLGGWLSAWPKPSAEPRG